VFIITLADTTGVIPGAGTWLKQHHGPDAVIFLIFFFSGLILDAGGIKSGLTDVSGILIALAAIFVAAPLIAALFGLAPLPPGIKIGIFLVAVMPTTLTSGVVMTEAAGGNMAHALVITLLANSLAVFTIPVSLSALLFLAGDSTAIIIDKTAIMIKIGMYVLVPLCLGLFLKAFTVSRDMELSAGYEAKLQIVNQCLVLFIVWMAVSQAKPTLVDTAGLIANIFFLVFIFHGLLLVCGYFLIKLFRLEKGRRESVIFMGGQKTLPLSVILQVTLFPQYGIAVAVCVIHHMVHLLMDGFIVGKMSRG